MSSVLLTMKSNPFRYCFYSREIQKPKKPKIIHSTKRPTKGVLLDYVCVYKCIFIYLCMQIHTHTYIIYYVYILNTVEDMVL